MKKISYMLIALLLAPTVVNAESNINTTFDNDKCTLTISGEQTGHEATVSLFNEQDDLIGFKTTEIKNGNYSIDFVLTYDSDKKINITVSNENGTNEISKNDTLVVKCEREEPEHNNNENNNNENNNHNENKDKSYKVEDESGNSISFKEEEGHEFRLTLFDFIGLTDEDLNKLNIPKDQYNEVLKTLLEITKKEGTLISFYQIEVEDENDHLIHEGPFKIRIKMTEAMKKYDSFKLIYVDTDDNFKTEDPIKLTKNGEYLEATLNHLSTYALVGNKEVSNDTNTTSKKDNPKTGDNILVYVGILGVSVLGLSTVIIYNKKKKVK